MYGAHHGERSKETGVCSMAVVRVRDGHVVDVVPPGCTVHRRLSRLAHLLDQLQEPPLDELYGEVGEEALHFNAYAHVHASAREVEQAYRVS